MTGPSSQVRRETPDHLSGGFGKSRKGWDERFTPECVRLPKRYLEGELLVMLLLGAGAVAGGRQPPLGEEHERGVGEGVALGLHVGARRPPHRGDLVPRPKRRRLR